MGRKPKIDNDNEKDTTTNEVNSNQSPSELAIETIKSDVLEHPKLTDKQRKDTQIISLHQKDIFHLFFLVSFFTLGMLVFKFVMYFLKGIIINIDLSKFAMMLNITISFVGSSEGLRSIIKSVGSRVGSSTPVPAYKLQFLFKYLLTFMFLTVLSLVFECIVKLSAEEGTPTPDFCANSFTNGIETSVISYLIARFGSKVSDGIDLSSFRIFKTRD